MVDLGKVLEEVKDWAREAGELQRANFRRRDLAIESKSNVTDLVTEIDRRSEEIITGHIRSNYPDHAILAEETGRNSRESDYLWVIDPLDGTNNYAQGLPIYCVSIGLRYKEETLLGVVYAPYLDELFWASKGQGAYCNGERIKVGRERELNRCVVATGFPYDKGTHPLNNLEYVERIVPHLRGIRRMGAAAYDLCGVAMGILDGYWEMNLSPWDVEAGMLIVEEAGGVVERFREDRGISIVAGNRRVVEKIEEKLK